MDFQNVKNKGCLFNAVLMGFKSIKYITFLGQWVQNGPYEHLSKGYISIVDADCV